MEGGRRQSRQSNRWGNNIRKWTGLEFGKSQRAVENREKMEETGCEIICGAQTTLVVKGYMMMMMMCLSCTVCVGKMLAVTAIARMFHYICFVKVVVGEWLSWS